MGVTGFAHIALSVSDADRSTAFYAEALGFAPGERFDLGVSTDPDAPPLPTVCQFLSRDGVQLALLQYPDPVAQPAPRPMHHLGLANFALHVDALEPVAQQILAHGGQVHRETLYVAPHGRTLHCSDPDGARVELMCMNG